MKNNAKANKGASQKVVVLDDKDSLEDTFQEPVIINRLNE